MRKKLSALVGLSLALFTLMMGALPALAGIDDPVFSTLGFRNRWIEQDRLVGTPGLNRFYTWGPGVVGAENIQGENYRESPGGQRQVQYFEKGRMEINQPFNGGNVTTGLLVRDLVSGQRQDGDNTFLSLPPSQTQVAGDDTSINPDAPVYASFKNVITFGTPDANSKPSATGTTITASINKTGQIGTIQPPQNLAYGTFQAETGHNVARIFEDYKNIRGSITEPISGNTIQNQPVYTSQPTVNVFGYAVTEPYWVKTKVGGTEQTVLVQLFQRRVLTYNPALSGDPLQKVEMGNLGQHYYKWRYIENKATATPTATISEAGCLPATSSTLEIQTCLSNISPASGSSVTLYARLIVGGKAASGAKLNAKWGFFNKQVECEATSSGGDGVASCAITVPGGSSNYLVDVEVNFSYNGQSYQTKTELIPA